VVGFLFVQNDGGAGNLLFLLMMLLGEQSVNQGVGLLANPWRATVKALTQRSRSEQSFAKGRSSRRVRIREGGGSRKETVGGNGCVGVRG